MEDNLCSKCLQSHKCDGDQNIPEDCLIEQAKDDKEKNEN